MIVNANSLIMPLADQSVRMCVISPPYWGLRDYGVEGQLGLEQTPEAYIANMVSVGREVWRVMKDDGTWWLNLGDSYASDLKGSGGPSAKQDSNRGSRYGTKKINHGLKSKDLCMIPARVALALQADGWYLRAEIIWAKPNPMPESVTDRPTRSHEAIYLLTKQARYYYDAEAVKEKAVEGFDLGLLRGREAGPDDMVSWHAPSIAKRQAEGVDSRVAGNGYRNQRDVWTIATEPYEGAHYATFPTEIPRRAILAGSKPGDIVLDCFAGSGTTGEVCRELGRKFVGLDLSMNYLRENALPRAERKQTQESIDRLPLFGGNGDGDKLIKQDSLGKQTYTGFNERWSESHSK